VHARDEPAGDEAAGEGAVRDERLRLIFTCRHPAITVSVQAALTLRLLGGLIRGDLCAEAIRLGRLLAGLMPGEPEVMGLLALMLLIESRRAARMTPDDRPHRERGRARPPAAQPPGAL